jgi:hypothetical protein
VARELIASEWTSDIDSFLRRVRWRSSTLDVIRPGAVGFYFAGLPQGSSFSAFPAFAVASSDGAQNTPARAREAASRALITA